MIKRYSTTLSKIWSEQAKIKRWLEIEATVAEIEGELGIIPKGIAKGVRKLRISPKRIAEIEKEVQHDIIAFLKTVKEKIGKQADYLHFGLTSYDLVDTALSMALKEAGLVIKKSLVDLIAALDVQVKNYRDTPIMGRTHGMFAEPTLLGLKFLSWREEMRRGVNRLEDAIAQISYGKISGAVGTYSQLPPIVEQKVMQRLGLKPEPVSTQIIPRDRHGYFLSILALIAAGLERIALDIRLHSRSEVGELAEPFSKKQRGSSAMPHKKNPIFCERICGLARLIRSNTSSAMENIALWHERDISHSSIERIILPDSTILCHYLIQLMNRVIKGLQVNEKKLNENIKKAFGVYFSQRLMLHLIEKGKDKDWVYKKIQQLSFTALNEKKDLKKVVLKDKQLKKILDKEELNKIFSFKDLVKETEFIYRQLLNSNPE